MASSTSSLDAASSARLSREAEESLAAMARELDAAASGSTANADGAPGAEGDADADESLPSREDALDLTTQDIDFAELGGDLRIFEQHELVREALEAERDLRNYSRDIDHELEEYEGKCVQDYLTSSESLSTLHSQIHSCDTILATMESMLSHFQSDLSAISAEIEYLQSKSYGMNIKLRNYKQGEKALNTFIQHIYIPDDLSNLILEGDLNEVFVQGLIELDKKLIHLEESKPQRAGLARPAHLTHSDHTPLPFSLAARDMYPIGEKLKLKSIARIRAFLLERFHSLKKPKTNIQIKQKLLLKFSYFYQFLLHHADESGIGGGSQPSSMSNLHAAAGTPTGAAGAGATAIQTDICAEIRREYHETISQIYYTKFKKYLSELRKLQEDNRVEKSDTLGQDDGSGTTKLMVGGGSGTIGPGGPIQGPGGLIGSSQGSVAGGGGGLMGGMLSGMSSMFSTLKKSSASIEHVFTLHGREDVLLGAAPSTEVGGPGAAGDRDLIIPHMPLAGSGVAATGKLPFEKLFRSSQSLLMDTATSEYDFIVEFFGERMARDMDRAGQHEDALAAEKEAEEKARAEAAAGGAKKSTAIPSYTQSQAEERGREFLLPHSRDKHLFNLVFGKTIQLFLEHLENYLYACHDALGILLVIRIVCQHNLMMQYRRVHCLDHLFDRMNMMLWPRFKSIFDENVASVMRCAYTEAKQISPSVKRFKPHYIGTRYAEFACGILFLNDDDDILVANLKRLRLEVDKFFQRSADRMIGPDSRRLKIVFLLTQYHAILTIFDKHDSTAAAAAANSAAARPGQGQTQSLSGTCNTRQSDDYKYWSDQRDLQVGKLIDEELGLHFKSLVEFARKALSRLTAHGAGAAGASSNASASASAAAAVAALELTGDFAPDQFRARVEEFAREWKGRDGRSGAQALHDDIRSFFDDGTEAAPAAAAAAVAVANGRPGSNASANAAAISATVAASSRAHLAYLLGRLYSQLQLYMATFDQLKVRYKGVMTDQQFAAMNQMIVGRSEFGHEIQPVIRKYAQTM